jgi:hypothetical protein
LQGRDRPGRSHSTPFAGFAGELFAGLAGVMTIYKKSSLSDCRTMSDITVFVLTFVWPQKFPRIVQASHYNDPDISHSPPTSGTNMAFSTQDF